MALRARHSEHRVDGIRDGPNRIQRRCERVVFRVLRVKSLGGADSGNGALDERCDDADMVSLGVDEEHSEALRDN